MTTLRRRFLVALAGVALAGCATSADPDRPGGLASDLTRFGVETGHDLSTWWQRDLYQAADAAGDVSSFFRGELASAPGVWRSNAREIASDTIADTRRTRANVEAAPGVVQAEIDRGIADLAADARYAAETTLRDARRTAAHAENAPGFVAAEVRQGVANLAADAEYLALTTQRDARRTAQNAAAVPGWVADEVRSGTAALEADARYAAETAVRDAHRTADNARAVPGFIASEVRQGVANLAADAEYAALTTRRDAHRTAENLRDLGAHIAVEMGEGWIRFVRRDLGGAYDEVLWDSRRSAENLADAAYYLMIVTDRDVKRTAGHVRRTIGYLTH